MQYNFINCIIQIAWALTIGNCFIWPLHSFGISEGCVCFFLCVFLIFWNYVMLQAHLVYFAPVLELTVSSGSHWFHLLENGMTQDLDAGCALCYGTAHCFSSPSADRERKYMCVH